MFIVLASGKVLATFECYVSLSDFPHQIWALRAIILLGSGHLAFKSALLCTFWCFPLLSDTLGALKVIKVFVDGLPVIYLDSYMRGSLKNVSAYA